MDQKIAKNLKNKKQKNKQQFVKEMTGNLFMIIINIYI